ncbi:DUF317 domain-containing protein [Streptomyces sp. NPDC093225]|uniref:DUF317 domain-containing protein n=1 Tax=Streptomyces sp. NPDC093225 TaxID=3366034 RepID=UPI00381D8348
MPEPELPDGDVFVTPRYLAGSSGVGDPGFAPVTDWPHHHLDDGPCQLLVTSPDHRIRIGWFGDDYDLWKVTAGEDASSAPRWTAIFNQNTPAELVAGLTTALASDWADSGDRFLAAPSYRWVDSVHPLLDAGWTHGSAERSIVEITAPDGQAGILIDRRCEDPDDVFLTLWAGPPGWGTRAEVIFTARTPTHLIAATAAAFTDPTPVARYQEHLHPELAALAKLTPVRPPQPPAPSPLDVQRASAARRPPAVTTKAIPRWSTSSLPPALPSAARAPARR